MNIFVQTYPNCRDGRRLLAHCSISRTPTSNRGLMTPHYTWNKRYSKSYQYPNNINTPSMLPRQHTNFVSCNLYQIFLLEIQGFPLWYKHQHEQTREVILSINVKERCFLGRRNALERCLMTKCFFQKTEIKRSEHYTFSTTF